MSKIPTEHNRTERDAEQRPILSAEEQAVLARIRRQAQGHRPGALTRFLKSPPVLSVVRGNISFFAW